MDVEPSPFNFVDVGRFNPMKEDGSAILASPGLLWAIKVIVHALSEVN
jgi:hypothetical protein